MEKLRKPFQGVCNIIRFNWHFYIIAVILFLLFIYASRFMPPLLSTIIEVISCLTLLSLLITLIMSYYIYDASGLYDFDWIKSDNTNISVLNINAGFDETSNHIKSKFPNSNFLALDFYNPDTHTEISIKRARTYYNPYPNTLPINTSKIELESNSIDKIFIIFAAHEIRHQKERILFFSELNRLLKPNGKIYVTEHLRDTANFLVYTIGAFHFYSKTSWLDTFKTSNLKLLSEIKHTPFISTFTLTKHGSSL